MVSTGRSRAVPLPIPLLGGKQAGSDSIAQALRQVERNRRVAAVVLYVNSPGGDGFASGLAYGFLEGKGPQAAVEYGAAHGALAMTTPGDTSMVNVKEVEAVMKGKGARVIR